MKKSNLTVAFLSLCFTSTVWAFPNGPVSQLEPTESKTYYMTLLQDVELDYLIEGFSPDSSSFYTNSAEYIVDGKLLTDEEYYELYEGQSHCKINLYDHSASAPKVIKGNTLASPIDDTVQVKDSNWKDGAYNWASFSSSASKETVYIGSVGCYIEGSLKARFSPPMSIEKMQQMLAGVVLISE